VNVGVYYRNRTFRVALFLFRVFPFPLILSQPYAHENQTLDGGGTGRIVWFEATPTINLVLNLGVNFFVHLAYRVRVNGSSVSGRARAARQTLHRRAAVYEDGVTSFAPPVTRNWHVHTRNRTAPFSRPIEQGR
jgi:hypothetical protein